MKAGTRINVFIYPCGFVIRCKGVLKHFMLFNVSYYTCFVFVHVFSIGMATVHVMNFGSSCDLYF